MVLKNFRFDEKRLGSVEKDLEFARKMQDNNMSEGSSSSAQYSLENQQQQSSSPPPQKTSAAFQPFTTTPQATNCLNQLPQGAAYAYIPNTIGGPVSQPASGVKTKRKQVKNACVNCQKACKKCDDGRPCQRCIKYELTETCQNSIRKERKKGIKRGPYKRRQQQRESATSADTNKSPCPEVVTPVTASIMFPVIPPSDPNAPPANPNPNPIPIPVTLQLPNFQPQTVAMQSTTPNSAIPSNIGQFVMIPATTGTTSYYVLVPPSCLQQQQQHPPPPSSNSTSAQGRRQSLSQTENIPKSKVEQSKVTNNEILGISNKATVKSSDRKNSTSPGGEKENEGANLSVLSQVCSDMLDKSQDDSRQSDDESKEKVPSANIEISKDAKFSPQASGECTSNDNLKVQNDVTILDEAKEKQSSAMVEEIADSGTKEITEDKKISPSMSNTDKEHINFKDVNPKQQVQSSISTTNDDGLVPINQTEEGDYHPSPRSPPTFSIPTVGSDTLYFQIPPNSYPVTPASHVPIKREVPFNDANSTTDYKHTGVSLCNGQAQFPNHIDVFPHQPSISQPYYHHRQNVQALSRSRNSESFNQLYTRYPVNAPTPYPSFVYKPVHNIASGSNSGSDASLQGKQNFPNY
ncbi:3686_t:CDS:2 [Acaulospora morrowiae]|uniref:3686_t:CDS:1 n=1 Tax=Acaulospora morrowiae TaxID=94023 RepID=A0A9N9F499_9GLOM|nr:3686_t:CDS:2 [Acaulospora morrowiae]